MDQPTPDLSTIKSIITDLTISSAAFSLPLWLQYLEFAAQAAAYLLTVILVALRCIVAYRELGKRSRT